MFICTEKLPLLAVENLLATGEGGQTFEPAKFKLLLHHRKLELQASNQVLMVFMAIVMIMVRTTYYVLNTYGQVQASALLSQA